MQQIDARRLWRADFLDAVRLLGGAAARLPYGALDPVLCGTGAAALYTGEFWAAGALEVRAADARVLGAELMALGCRWSECAPHAVRGFWHSKLDVAITIIDDLQAVTPGERANILTVTPEAKGAVGFAEPGLQVIGIEDLIVEHILCWLEQGAPAGDALMMIQMLIGLGEAGVCGRFRAAYLHRRLAWQTDGEVVLEPSLDYRLETRARRAISLAEMQVVIATWRACYGLSFGAADRRIRNRNGSQERGGRRPVTAANIIPFAAAPLGRWSP